MSGDKSQTTEPPGEGWELYLDPWGTRPPDASPYMHIISGATLELWRVEWGNETCFVSKAIPIHPASNVADLWWRLA